ncbi:MAG TPA: hypothetical protein VF246_10525 [Acidimicrobiia bacterium]
MRFERRLDPLWAQELGPLPPARDVARNVRRSTSDFLDGLTVRVSRAIEVTEASVVRTWERVKSTSMTQPTQMLRAGLTALRERPRPTRTPRRAPLVTPPGAIPTAVVEPIAQPLPVGVETAVQLPRSEDRRWLGVLSDRALTWAIAVASVVLLIVFLRTAQTLAGTLVDFLAQTVNGFLTRLGYPPAM